MAADAFAAALAAPAEPPAPEPGVRGCSSW
jgi:hypothetical protein